MNGNLLKTHNIEKSFFALEVEFIPVELPVLSRQQSKAVQDLRYRVIEHARQTPEKLSIVENFTAEQLMMYELHDLDAETKDILEYLFGTGREDNSYYDAVIGSMRCMELKLKPGPPEKLIENLDIILSALDRKVHDYGLKITDPKVQLNISFYKNGKNIFDPLNPAFINEGAWVISGILESIYNDSHNHEFMYVSATGATPLISLSPGREGFARLTGEGDHARLELRLSRCGATIKDINLKAFIETVMNGATYGLENKKCGLKKIKRGIFERKVDNLKIILHVLQGSEIKRTINPFIFRLKPPEQYITGWMYLNFAKIAMELGYEPISPTVNYDTIKFLDPGKYDELMQEYKDTTLQRLQYMHALSKKEKRNPLEELEYKFLKQHMRGESISWPEKEKFHEHFSMQAEKAMIMPQVLDFFRNIRIVRKGKNYKIIWPEETILFGKIFKINNQALNNIECKGFAVCFKQERRELPKKN